MFTFSWKNFHHAFPNWLYFYFHEKLKGRFWRVFSLYFHQILGFLRKKIFNQNCYIWFRSTLRSWQFFVLFCKCTWTISINCNRFSRVYAVLSIFSAIFCTWTKPLENKSWPNSKHVPKSHSSVAITASRTTSSSSESGFNRSSEVLDFSMFLNIFINSSGNKDFYSWTWTR